MTSEDAKDLAVRLTDASMRLRHALETARFLFGNVDRLYANMSLQADNLYRDKIFFAEVQGLADAAEDLAELKGQDDDTRSEGEEGGGPAA